MKDKKNYVLISEGWTGTKELNKNSIKNFKLSASSIPKRENIILKNGATLTPPNSSPKS
ncbi:MAG: hypothetical protein ACRCZ0_02415 [Cetobacterium sp.]